MYIYNRFILTINEVAPNNRRALPGFNVRVLSTVLLASPGWGALIAIGIGAFQICIEIFVHLRQELAIIRVTFIISMKRLCIYIYIYIHACSYLLLHTCVYMSLHYGPSTKWDLVRQGGDRNRANPVSSPSSRLCTQLLSQRRPSIPGGTRRATFGLPGSFLLPLHRNLFGTHQQVENFGQIPA